MKPVSKFEKHALAILVALTDRVDLFPEVKVSALFNSKMTKVSDSKMEVEIISGTPVGKANVIINPVALIQDPKLVFELVIAHEYAHVLTKLASVKDGVHFAEHGDEWMEFLHLLDASEASLPVLTSDELDFSASKILKGYVTFLCSCSRTFAVVPNTTKGLAKYLDGEERCNYCQSHLERVGKESYPPKIINEINYLKKLDEIREN